MGDTSDGSSSAAQSAQPEGQIIGKIQNRGFLARLFSRNKAHITEALERHDPVIPSGGLGNLRALRVEDVAIPRADIVSLPITASFDEIVKTFKDSQLTRLPVYDDGLDNPLGMVHLKDIALKHGFNGKPNRFSLKRIMRPVLFAPPSMPIGVLLQKMQSEATHMALLIDEYGGVDGLLTIEDLIEQVIGEIVDEHDMVEETAWIEEKPGIYLVQARANLEEFEKVLGVDFATDTEDEDIDTLGGLVFMLIGRVPARGEVISHSSGYEFEVVDADARRVKRLRVCKSTSPAKD